MTLKRKVSYVLLVNAGLILLGMIVGMVDEAGFARSIGTDATPVMGMATGAVYAAGVLAVVNLVVGFFLILGTATLEVSKLRGWGKAMLISGPVLALFGAVFLGLSALWFFASYR